MVAAAVAAAMEVGRERPEVRRLGLHVCRYGFHIYTLATIRRK
jgi:hypothetical protein